MLKQNCRLFGEVREAIRRGSLGLSASRVGPGNQSMLNGNSAPDSKASMRRFGTTTSATATGAGAGVAALTAVRTPWAAGAGAGVGAGVGQLLVRGPGQVRVPGPVQGPVRVPGRGPVRVRVLPTS